MQGWPESQGWLLHPGKERAGKRSFCWPLKSKLKQKRREGTASNGGSSEAPRGEAVAQPGAAQILGNVRCRRSWGIFRASLLALEWTGCASTPRAAAFCSLPLKAIQACPAFPLLCLRFRAQGMQKYKLLLLLSQRQSSAELHHLQQLGLFSAPHSFSTKGEYH